MERMADVVLSCDERKSEIYPNHTTFEKKIQADWKIFLAFKTIG